MLLPLYAVLVWFMCYRLRRTWMGWFALTAAVLIVLSGIVIYPQLQRWFTGTSTSWSSFQFVMWGEAIMVAIVGIFVLLLPREIAQFPCRRCRYELESLLAEHPEHNPQCPECGLDNAVRKPGKPVLDETLAWRPPPTPPKPGAAQNVSRDRSDVKVTISGVTSASVSR